MLRNFRVNTLYARTLWLGIVSEADTKLWEIEDMKTKMNAHIYWLPLVALAAFAVAVPSSPAAADEHGWNWTDARREGAIWSALAMNRHLNPFRFSVDVNDGEATLSGTVDDEIKRDLAEEVALGVDGIDRVTNNIVVEPAYETAEESPQRTLWDATTDATTTAAVKSRLLWNRNVSGMDIGVSTEDGVVTLTGEVETSEEKDLAGELAENSQGVESVNNELTVLNEPAPVAETERVAEAAVDTADDLGDRISDAWIRTKVKSALVFTRNVPGGAIHVRVNDGVVDLRGIVDSEDQKTLAIATAEDIRGVVRVDTDNLIVEN